MQSQILASSHDVLQVCQSQSDAEWMRVNIDLKSGSTGAAQFQTLNVDDGSLYSAAAMERFRVRLFSISRVFCIVCRGDRDGGSYLWRPRQRQAAGAQ